jgi:hypothetical protein
VGLPSAYFVSTALPLCETKVIWNYGARVSLETGAMKKTARPQLLPGVANAGIAPQIVIESRNVIRRARLRATLRDVADLLLLLVVDALFIRWPRAHVPLLDRHDTVLALFSLNVLLIAYVWLSRQVPQWHARRVSSTWCPTERQRITF